jgi:hypothetical protein
VERPAPAQSSARRGSGVRSAVRWVLGAPSTALLGGVITAVSVSRGWWIGAVVLAVATIALTAAEVWGWRVGGDGPEWAPLRWAYLCVVAAASGVYAAATGDAFYRVLLPALLFVPAVIQAGRGIHARREGAGIRNVVAGRRSRSE